MGKKKKLKKKLKHYNKKASAIKSSLKELKDKKSRIGFKWYD